MYLAGQPDPGKEHHPNYLRFAPSDFGLRSSFGFRVSAFGFPLFNYLLAHRPALG